MKTNLMKQAYNLWRCYKTQTEGYRKIAEALGITRLDLNSRCHDMMAAARSQKDSA